VSLAKPDARPDDGRRPTVSADDAALLEAVRFECKHVVVGQDRVLERLLVCMLAGGHCLLEGVPGLAKTLAAETMALATGGSFTRIQFTPDLIPSDIVGTRIYRASSETFDVELGPVFSHFVLADEINRAPAKVQSALLEVMAERQVSIGGTTYPVPEPFLVVATQNPIESEGVYPLPEAQRDRFLMKVLVDYPTPIEELEIVRRMGVDPPVASPVIDPTTLARLQRVAAHVYVDPGVIDYAVRLVLATRQPEQHGLAHLRPFIAFGVSPRASLGLVAAGRALAVLRGRGYVVPQDVFDVAPEVLRHRLVLTYDAVADGVRVDDLVAHVLAIVLAPRITPGQDEVLITYANHAALAEARRHQEAGWGSPATPVWPDPAWAPAVTAPLADALDPTADGPRPGTPT
jgi:MoxR-like ATPase